MFRLNKILSFMLVVIIFSSFAISTSAFEKQENNTINQLIKVVNQNTYIDNNRLIIKNKNNIIRFIDSNLSNIISKLGYDIENVKSDDIYRQITYMILETNKKLESGNYTLLNNESIINNNRQSYHSYSAKRTEHFWWGVRHTFYTDAAAKKYAFDLRMTANLNTGIAAIAGAIFGGVGAIPNGLTALYGQALADCVDYNANLPGDGVILDINYFLFYTCNPR